MVPAELLASVSMFRSLSPEVSARLSAVMTERALGPGESVFDEGERGDALYFIVEGKVVIQKVLDKESRAVKSVAALGPGDFLGEMALLEDAPRSASALALTDARLLRLSREEFGEFLRGDPSAAMAVFLRMVTTLSARLRETTREMVSLFEVGRTLAQDLAPRALAQRLLSVVRGSFDDDVFGVYYLWNEFSGEYEPAAKEGGPPESATASRPSTDPLLRWMAEKKECLLSEDWRADERFPAAVRVSWPGWASLLAAPVLGERRPFGYFIFGHAKDARVFLPGQRQVLAGISNLVAPAFQNALWREENLSRQRLERGRQSR
jgi:CRP-like cAMP-binding protein